MKLIGLTGSIGMGKSTTAAMFADEGVPVYDADAAVHRIYAAGGRAVEPVGARFPSVIVDGAVDRARLREAVLDDSVALKELEAIVHPLVGQEQLAFLEDARTSGADLVVLDIPLLFETGGINRVDLVVVVTTTAEEQQRRVLARDGMTMETFEAILAKQVPDSEKRARADALIVTTFGLDYARAQVRALVPALRGA